MERLHHLVARGVRFVLKRRTSKHAAAATTVVNLLRHPSGVPRDNQSHDKPYRKVHVRHRLFQQQGAHGTTATTTAGAVVAVATTTSGRRRRRRVHRVFPSRSSSPPPSSFAYSLLSLLSSNTLQGSGFDGVVLDASCFLIRDREPTQKGRSAATAPPQRFFQWT